MYSFCLYTTCSISWFALLICLSHGSSQVWTTQNNLLPHAASVWYVLLPLHWGGWTDQPHTSTCPAGGRQSVWFCFMAELWLSGLWISYVCSSIDAHVYTSFLPLLYSNTFFLHTLLNHNITHCLWWMKVSMLLLWVLTPIIYHNCRHNKCTNKIKKIQPELTKV